MRTASERELVEARSRARLARRRATQASERAARFERLATDGPSDMRDLNLSIVASLRRAAEMQDASARLQDAYATQIEIFLDREGTPAPTPRFLTAVGDLIGARSTVVTLWSREHVVAVSMGTDALARAVLDIELTVGEGPAHATALERRPVVVRRSGLGARWPNFARAAAPLQLHVVASVPMERADDHLGALTVVDPPQDLLEARMGTLRSVAAALVETLSEEFSSTDEGTGRTEARSSLPLLAEDSCTALHQAAGVVAVHAQCDTAAALALIQARAFADEMSISILAARIIAGELRLGI
ncbi:MAG: GAF domain-containing protein [Nocardioides sp.]|nr:GAF domain-containing protein [Nocardioides sp.]